MIRVRKSTDRGHADLGWLDSRHTFSFGSYYDPDHMGFRGLRVLNDDRVQPGQGFGTHGHRDMEIVSYVVEGALEHRDSMGNGSVLRAGDVQRMTAGRGVTHSEFNPSDEDRLRFLQIWLLPDRQGLDPGYEEKHFDEEQKRGRLRRLVSPTGDDGALRIHHDVEIFAALLDPDSTVERRIAPGRHAWLQVVRGEVEMGEHRLGEGDGAALSEEDGFEVRARTEAELLLFDLA